MNSTRLLLVSLIIIPLTLGSTAPVAAEPSKLDREHKIKAVFLYNIMNFITFPDDVFPGDEDAIVLGVVGEDPFGEILDKVFDGKSFSGRPVKIRRIRDLESRPQFEGVHVMYLGSLDHEALEKVLNLLRVSRILLISDMKGFAEMGGTINLVVKENKVRFKINSDAVKRHTIKISSRLMSLATIVRENASSDTKGNP